MADVRPEQIAAQPGDDSIQTALKLLQSVHSGNPPAPGQVIELSAEQRATLQKGFTEAAKEHSPAFEHANLSFLDLHGLNLSGLDLKGADLRGVRS